MFVVVKADPVDVGELGLPGREQLWIAGRLPDGPRLAVVGSRAARRSLTTAIAPGLEEARSRGWTLVSGGARGVDAVAHRVALELSLPQVAVLPLGPDRVYPEEHGPLVRRIVDEGGGVVFARAPGTRPTRGMFASRNRWVVGLAAAVWVVQAGARSGSLGTGRLALRQGIPVAALPRSAGAAELIARGARSLAWPADPDPAAAASLRAGLGAFLDGRGSATSAWPPELQPLARELGRAGPRGLGVDELSEPLLGLSWLAEAERLGLVLEVAPGRYVCAEPTADSR